jgi:hypothetical protein
VDETTLREVIGRHLLAALKPIDFDISGGFETGGMDIATDEWTIHLEASTGFLAIDDEPEQADMFAAARRKVMNIKVERALAAADRELGGGLSALLEASGDALTLDFVAALRSQDE